VKPKQQLLQSLTAHVEKHAPSAFWVAYSGGLDSTVLLYLAQQVADHFPGVALKAVHVHHGLLAEADSWVTHCQVFCDRLAIPLSVCHVDARPEKGQSPEAAARDARYTALRGLMASGDTVLLAHHQEDQAETVLLQLLRGAGPRGLSGMAEESVLGEGFKLRPLLGCSRAQLLAIAEQYALSWIEDPSNVSTDFDRNFLRQSLIPQLRQRWPGLSKSLSRSAALCGEADQLIELMAMQDLNTVLVSNTENKSVPPFETTGLYIPALLTLPIERRHNVLRRWCRLKDLPLPALVHLQGIDNTVLAAREDAQPLLQWPGAEARRYQQRLFLARPLSTPQTLDQSWDLARPLNLGDGRYLVAQPASGRGLAREFVLSAPLRVSFREGGEQIQPQGDSHTRTLHKLFQRAGVPPWERDRIPLLWQGKQLLAVVGYWLAAACVAGDGEPGVQFVVTESNSET